jgi:Peptidase M66
MNNNTTTTTPSAPAEKSAHEDGYQPGAILESSWGYDQTNVDYFQIVKRTNDTVFLIPLNSRNVESKDMRGQCIPADPMQPGEYVSCVGTWNGKPIRRRLCRYKESINNPPSSGRIGQVFGCSIKHGWCRLWDGSPSHWTAYA